MRLAAIEALYSFANESQVKQGLIQSIATQPSPMVQIDPRLVLSADDVVFRKTHASCFFGTPLDGWLRSAKADSVVICGFSTSGCVRATAVDALQHEYRVVVVEDCVGDRDRDAHVANLHDIDAKYGDVGLLASLKERLADQRAKLAGQP